MRRDIWFNMLVFVLIWSHHILIWGFSLKWLLRFFGKSCDLVYLRNIRCICEWILLAVIIDTVWAPDWEERPLDIDTQSNSSKVILETMEAGKRMPILKPFLLRQRLQGMHTYLWLCVMFCLVLMSEGSPSKPCEKSCLSGRCVNGSCVCDRGWVGDQCQHCQGRFKWVIN